MTSISRCLVLPALLCAAAFPELLAAAGPIAGLDASDAYLVYYGNWDAAKVNTARNNYDLVILHPQSNLTAAHVAAIKAGPDAIAGTADDVLVVAYLSVGEDDRPAAPVAGGGTGPRVDPRPSDSTPLAYIEDNNAWLGDPSPGGTAYASYYLDDSDSDGNPDQNSIFGAYYVNAGDPAWYAVLKSMVYATDGQAGIDEILTTTVGRGLGCDGLFLDTLDTAAPNSFGTAYEWTAPGMQDLVRNIALDYPGALLIGNRGLFFFNPNLKNYDYNFRSELSALMFESYHTDSSNANRITPGFDSNKHEYAPKLNAEAGYADGFTLIALGYDNPADLTPAEIEQDYTEMQGEQGWLAYRSVVTLDQIHTDQAAWNAANPDVSAPVWDSTAATSADSDSVTPGNQAPTPRTGIQEAEPGDGQVTVRWDVARDQTQPVRYNIYYTDEAALDFGTATKIAHAVPTQPDDYARGTGTNRFPYEYTVTGLTNGTTYKFAVRAEDSLAVPLEEANTVELEATPRADGVWAPGILIDGSMDEWEGQAPALMLDPAGDGGTGRDVIAVYLANDATSLYVRLQSADADAFDGAEFAAIDGDNNNATGFDIFGQAMGSDTLVAGESVYGESAGAFNEGAAVPSTIAWGPSSATTDIEFALSLSTALPAGADIATAFPGALGSTIRFLYGDDNAGAGDVVGPFAYKLATDSGAAAAPVLDTFDLYPTNAAAAARTRDASTSGFSTVRQAAVGNGGGAGMKVAFTTGSTAFGRAAFLHRFIAPLDITGHSMVSLDVAADAANPSGGGQQLIVALIELDGDSWGYGVALPSSVAFTTLTSSAPLSQSAIGSTWFAQGLYGTGDGLVELDEIIGWYVAVGEPSPSTAPGTFVLTLDNMAAPGSVPVELDWFSVGGH
ncbi:MAG: hypothetical protein PWP23_2239 [Candidatus Sumerlaeota bacterium]|nr:hypothetical protein [Candidatus Sumerlaeota bacterium]